MCQFGCFGEQVTETQTQNSLNKGGSMIQCRVSSGPVDSLVLHVTKHPVSFDPTALAS